MAQTLLLQGCPVAPPMPVSASDTCSSGDWHITLPSELPASIQNATGAGVTVFVLDTLPTSAQIWQAVTNSGDSNALLLDFAENVTPNYQFLSDALDASQTSQPATGNDINGDLTGFPMSDHGVFIAGIIRDLAPGAKVECIRVLNDYGVGDTVTLIDALNQIQGRILDGTINTPVVVNMSLTTAPAIETLATLGFNDQNTIAAPCKHCCWLCYPWNSPTWYSLPLLATAQAHMTSTQILQENVCNLVIPLPLPILSPVLPVKA